MSIEGVIFDVDGTILDSMSIWDTIAEDYLRSLGYEPKENLTEVFKDMTLAQATHYYQREYKLNLSDDEIITGVNSKKRWIYHCWNL